MSIDKLIINKLKASKKTIGSLFCCSKHMLSDYPPFPGLQIA